MDNNKVIDENISATSTAAQTPDNQPTIVEHPTPQNDGAAPTVSEPVIDHLPNPVIQQPQQPIVQQPVYQQPVVQQPVYQQPVYQQPVMQQPVYQQPGVPMAYAPIAPNAPAPGHDTAVGSLALGIIGLVLSFVYGLGLIPSIIGLCLAGSAKKKGNNEGIRTAGVATSVIGLIFSVLMVLLIVALFAFLGYVVENDPYYYSVFFNLF